MVARSREKSLIESERLVRRSIPRRSRPAAGEHRHLPAARRDSVDTSRQLGQAATRHLRKGMMLEVVQQVEGESVEPPSALGSRHDSLSIAAVVDEPHREETGEAISEQHDHDVVAQQGSPDSEGARDERGKRDTLRNHPSQRKTARGSQSKTDQAQREERSADDREPAGHPGAPPLHVIVTQRIAVVFRVVELDRVQRRQHQKTQDEQERVVRAGRETEVVVKAVVRLAQRRREEEERSAERDQVLLMPSQPQRTDQQRQRQSQSAESLPVVHHQQIAPCHAREFASRPFTVRHGRSPRSWFRETDSTIHRLNFQ
jgi:hypothetical protein